MVLRKRETQAFFPNRKQPKCCNLPHYRHLHVLMGYMCFSSELLGIQQKLLCYNLDSITL